MVASSLAGSTQAFFSLLIFTVRIWWRILEANLIKPWLPPMTKSLEFSALSFQQSIGYSAGLSTLVLVSGWFHIQISASRLPVFACLSLQFWRQWFILCYLLSTNPRRVDFSVCSAFCTVVRKIKWQLLSSYMWNQRPDIQWCYFEFSLLEFKYC